jgi:hypothetical protein
MHAECIPWRNYQARKFRFIHVAHSTEEKSSVPIFPPRTKFHLKTFVAAGLFYHLFFCGRKLFYPSLWCIKKKLCYASFRAFRRSFAKLQFFAKRFYASFRAFQWSFHALFRAFLWSFSMLHFMHFNEASLCFISCISMKLLYASFRAFLWSLSMLHFVHFNVASPCFTSCIAMKLL